MATPIIVTPLSSSTAGNSPLSKLPPEAAPSPATALVIFGHELPSGSVQDLLRRLHRVSKEPQHALLARFLKECAAVLRHEVQRLPWDQRETVPPFGDVVTLGSHWDTLRRGPVRGAWEGAVVCIYQLAMIIGYHEATNAPYLGGNPGLGKASTCLAGISIGLFSAAAAAVSTSLLDLVSYGTESVRIAFVFSLHVGRISELLETTGNSPQDKQAPAAAASTWAAVITDLSVDAVQAELDLFNGDEESEGAATELTRISVSHVDRASVGITGPPARLQKLFRCSKTLGASRHAALPITGGLCHVAKVYDEENVQSILKASQVWEKWGFRPIQQSLLSPHTGNPFLATNASCLIEEICLEALTKPLFFDKIADGAVDRIINNLKRNEGTVAPPCQILHYPTSIVTENIIAGVEQGLSTATRAQRRDLTTWTTETDEPAPLASPSSTQDSKLAVVGMACRLPGDANTPDEFWKLLVAGRDTHTVVPPDRFDIEAHFDPSGETENAVGTRFGNFISNPGHFDAGFFNMSPREAQQTDPMQRLALVTAYEALEMAGFVPNRTPSSHVSRVGTYYGQASDDYREVNACQKIGTYGIPGTERAFGNGRINYFFNFEGPSLNIDTACSSGLAAVQAACSALWAGEADTVVAGGLNVITSPDIYCMLGKGHFLSQTGQCKVWDAGADGYCRADGVGSVVIKRLDDALADNDLVLGTILAGATNHSAQSVSITQPHAGIQKKNYSRVMDLAGISPLDVSFVELHGTGTQVGDAVESESVVDFFAPLGKRLRPEQRLHLGAVKSNIGHGEAAAGIASLIKVLLMYRHGIIPRHIGIKSEMNPVVAQKLAGRNANVVFENIPWVVANPDGSRGTSSKRYSIVNSFGAHGGNTSLLLEDAPSMPHVSVEEGSQEETSGHQVVCISAKSKASLRGNVGALLNFLDANAETRLQDLAYTTCARRMHHHIRIAESVSSTAQLKSVLREALEDLDSRAQHISGAAPPRKIVFAFSGQGNFYRGAAAALWDRSPDFRIIVAELDRVVVQLGLPSVHDALVNSTDDAEYGPLVTQLAIVVLQIALARYWRLLGITPDAVVGHSLGEYAALCTAGVLSVADTLFLVGRRAELTIAACKPHSHVMMSVRGISAAEIVNTDRITKPGISFDVSCINGRQDTVISGDRDSIEALREILTRQVPDVKCVLLDIPYAYHSAQLDPVLQEFEHRAQRAVFKAPTIPVISPLLGRCVSEGQFLDATYLRRAMREPVDFMSAVGAAAAGGLADENSVWIDLGPHPVCSSFVRNCWEQGSAVQTFPSLRRDDAALSAWSKTLAGLHRLGLPLAWNEYFSRREKCHRLLHLDPYQWNTKNYWIAYEGTWTLAKANPTSLMAPQMIGNVPTRSFSSSSVQRVILEEVRGNTARMAAISDLWHPDLLGAASGHKINGRSVLTASIWADVCLTVGEHLYKKLVTETKGNLCMNIRDMEVVEAQVLSEQDPSSSVFPSLQAIRIEAFLDKSLGETKVSLYAAKDDGSPKSDRAFATAMVCYEDPKKWMAEWQTASHLVLSRTKAMWDSSSESDVSTLSRSAAYQLFANVVEYGEQYRGMRRVALVQDRLEATAEVVLEADRHGTWHTPPHWIDSAFQVAGFVMNSFGSQADGSPSRDFFFITPGWRHFRLMVPLAPGPSATYRNYVRMFAVEGEKDAYAGDMFLMHGDKLIGVCAGIKFKRVPRALMPVMFPKGHRPSGASLMKKKVEAPSISAGSRTGGKTTEDASARVLEPPAAKGKNPRVAACVQLIAQETGLDIEDLPAEAAFADVGVDSLMSLTLADKMQSELGMEVKASLFLECSTVGELEEWLMKQTR